MDGETPRPEWLRDHDLLIEVRTIVSHLQQLYIDDRAEANKWRGQLEARVRTLEDRGLTFEVDRWQRVAREWDEFQAARAGEQRIAARRHGLFLAVASLVSSVIASLVGYLVHH